MNAPNEVVHYWGVRSVQCVLYVRAHVCMPAAIKYCQNKLSKIIRKNMEEVDKALALYSKTKVVKYLGQVKSGQWVDGDNKGQKV